MKLIGKLIKGPSIIKNEYVVIEDEDISYRELLEKCFINLCKKLNISVPMWLSKNTKEYARFKRTSFEKDQFLEKVLFDRFEIRAEE